MPATSNLNPTTSDIRAVTGYLMRLGLPQEIVQIILDHARYWSGCLTVSTDEIKVFSHNSEASPVRSDILGEGQVMQPPEGVENRDGEVVCMITSAFGGGDDEAGAAGRSDELNGVDADKLRSSWLREVVVETLSKDQGWSSFPQHHGTYRDNYTWFEIALLRDGREVPESRQETQHNVHAGKDFKHPTTTLTAADPVVRLARQDDRLILWARALYPGWSNHFKKGTVTAYSAPFPQHH
ncbi:hypothetical protein IAT38_001975 [Cryptococcus sp. DSM 104549]